MVQTETPDRHIPSFILSSPLRRLFENPYSILREFIKEGMTVLDHGSGPGFYTIPMAKLVGEKGRSTLWTLTKGLLRDYKEN
ncbi:MAG: hypothetical protein RXR08_03625 [Sulfolobaceae archaeon]